MVFLPWKRRGDTKALELGSDIDIDIESSTACASRTQTRAKRLESPGAGLMDMYIKVSD